MIRMREFCALADDVTIDQSTFQALRTARGNTGEQ
jgi:hypothetical protein